MTHPAAADDLPPDLELAARWRDGDERSATLLVTRHAPALARYVAALGITDEVEEVVQDTFVRAFASLDGFRGESSLATWLFTIARRLVADRRRVAARAGRLTDLDEAIAGRDGDPLELLVAGETARRVGAAVARLTPLQREVFLLRVSHGLSYREIAAVAGTTEGAARVHYHTALKAVKERLDE